MTAPTILDTIILPEYISQDSTFYYEFSTDISETLSGAEQRVANWVDYRFSGDISSAVVSKDILDDILAIFAICKGRAYAFRVYYEPDCDVVDGYLGTGDASEDEFQLRKTFTFGGYSYHRDCYKIFGSPTIKFDDVAQSSGWTHDATTGLVTFTNPPSAGVVITGDFTWHYAMRFDVDKISTQWKTYQVGEARIPLIEVR